METPGKGPEQPLSRRQRKRARQKDRVGQTSEKAQVVSRRNVLKAMLPGGWIGEARSGGLGNLSTPAKISLVKDAALILGPAVLVYKESTEQAEEQSLKEKVLSFTWRDIENNGKLRSFVESLADSYLQVTQTPRLTREDLIGENRTTFYKSEDAFIQGVRVVEPNYQSTETHWGYTHYLSKRVFIDLESLKKQALTQNAEAGLALIDALWHEWGHLDLADRTSGELLNNPQAYFYSPVSSRNELLRRYRGGAVYTDTYYGFLRFEEVWNETITVRRMVEQVGLDQVVSARDYYQNGVDFFPRFTSSVNIPLDTLYQMHAASDFEGFSRLVGQNLPGSEPTMTKGVRLFSGIHQSDPSLIRQTGVFERIPR